MITTKKASLIAVTMPLAANHLHTAVYAWTYIEVGLLKSIRQKQYDKWELKKSLLNLDAKDGLKINKNLKYWHNIILMKAFSYYRCFFSQL